jgi:hypothetical protein
MIYYHTLSKISRWNIAQKREKESAINCATFLLTNVERYDMMEKPTLANAKGRLKKRPTTLLPKLRWSGNSIQFLAISGATPKSKS